MYGFVELKRVGPMALTMFSLSQLYSFYFDFILGSSSPYGERGKMTTHRTRRLPHQGSNSSRKKNATFSRVPTKSQG